MWARLTCVRSFEILHPDHCEEGHDASIFDDRLVMSSTLLSQQQSKPVKPAEDMSKMPPAAHAPLFQAPKSVEAGAITDRVTAGLPALPQARV